LEADITDEYVFEVRMTVDLLGCQARVHDLMRSRVHDVVWLDLATAIDYAVAFDQAGGKKAAALTLFPALCSVAVGGDILSALPLAASWRLYFLASRILDDVVDRDAAGRPWAFWSADRAMHVGLGLIFAAQSGLSQLPTPLASGTADTISEALLRMTHGQATPAIIPNLEDYFQHVIRKAGLFFAVFARLGARLHTECPRDLQAMFDFGLALGTWQQLRNDCHELQEIYTATELSRGHYTLPVIYGLTSPDHPNRHQLEALITAREAWGEPEWHRARDILIQMGTPQYCAKIIAIYATKAEVILAAYPGDQTQYLRMLLLSEGARE
jgi:geranylgeranyl pyrophosphate synthase